MQSFKQQFQVPFVMEIIILLAWSIWQSEMIISVSPQLWSEGAKTKFEDGYCRGISTSSPPRGRRWWLWQPAQKNIVLSPKPIHYGH
jgi:hypothetical protein